MVFLWLPKVLLKIDGRKISDDGQIELRGHELIQHRHPSAQTVVGRSVSGQEVKLRLPSGKLYDFHGLIHDSS